VLVLVILYLAHPMASAAVPALLGSWLCRVAVTDDQRYNGGQSDHASVDTSSATGLQLS
jgi:hypothetical protein